MNFNENESHSENESEKMLEELLRSLSLPQKSISSKYLYDSKGCELFQKITELDEYYLTRCEKEILREATSSIGAKIKKYNKNKEISLIEVGPGDGVKGLLVSKELLKMDLKFNYYGLDICEKALDILNERFIALKDFVQPKLLLGDYTKISTLMPKDDLNAKLILFLGSSIGNMTHLESKKFIRSISKSLDGNDFFLLGFDLKKDKNILSRAYNDSLGVTAQFNLNLLTRFNRELGANFNLNQFSHEEFYDSELGAMKSYLVSHCDQVVNMAGHNIYFKKQERIHTEYSFKYSKEDILNLFEGTGLEIEAEYYDSKKYFASYLFRKTAPNPKMDQGKKVKNKEVRIKDENDTSADEGLEYLWGT